MASAISDVSVDEDAPDETIDLASAFSDPEQAAGDLSFAVNNNTNSGLVSTMVDNATDELTLSFAQDASGSATITDGASSNLDFTAEVSPGANDNAVGIFELSAGQSGATLTDVSITNNSPGVSGIPNARLYLSADQTLVPGEDQQVANFDVTDGSAEEEFDFTGIGTSVPTNGYYAILAIDVASGASASGVQFFLDQTSDLTVTGGEIATVNGNSQSTFSALELSNGTTALPVELARFDATTSDREAVTLQWETLRDQQRRVCRPAALSWRARDAPDRRGRSKGVSAGRLNQRRCMADGQIGRRRRDHDRGAVLPIQGHRCALRRRLLDLPPEAGRHRRHGQLLRADHSREEHRSAGAASGDLPEPGPQPGNSSLCNSKAITLRLYDALGRQVRTVQAAAKAGRHTLRLDTE